MRDAASGDYLVGDPGGEINRYREAKPDAAAGRLARRARDHRARGWNADKLA